MSQIIDRRLNGKNKSAVNRRRFIERYRNQIKRAVSDAVKGRSITEIDQSEKINIPTRDIAEPVFRHGSGGSQEVIQPGNKEFIDGDQLERPPQGGGQGGGSQASQDGEGEDDFMFELSREEFMEFFFEDLELPDLVKTQLTSMDSFKMVRAGHTAEGIPTNINVVRSLQGALARRMALRAPYVKELRELEAQHQVAPDAEPDADLGDAAERIQFLRYKVKTVPFIDTFDLRYNNRVKQPMPSTSAVMFCLMDVSGSMSQERKDIAKRFFTLLYLFLQRAYKKIDVVFIRHHTTAKEVDEEEFFYSRESGGTVVSSALELMQDIIRERYPSNEWNIYAAQASDGDNWDNDSDTCREILVNSILPQVQYYAYVEITERDHQKLWAEYEKIDATYEHFAMRHIEDVGQIYPIFRDLFRKKVA